MSGARHQTATLRSADLKKRREELLARAIDDVVWEWDLLSDHVWWSLEAEHILGYPLGEIEPNPRWRRERIHPDDREAVETSMQEVIAGRKSTWSIEYRWRRNDGTYVFILDRGRAENVSGSPRRVIGTMSDIDARAQAHLSVRELEQRHRQVLDAIADWVLVKGPGSRSYGQTERFVTHTG